MKNERKKGISLISLVITIIVIIILAGAIILTINNNNPLENANKARFQSDLRSFQDELTLYHGNQAVNTAGMYQANQLNSDTTSINYTGNGTIDTTGNIFHIITSLKGSKYENEITVVKGELSFSGTNAKEIAWASELGIGTQTSANGENKPEASMISGMIPVCYDEGTATWKKADINNQDSGNKWFDYSTSEKRWANVVTVIENGTKTRQEYLNAPAGTAINMADITTMWVWVPRYAYSIQGGAYKKAVNNAQGKIDVKFLVGNSNEDIDGKTYATDYDASKVNAGQNTPYIVHPAFHFGGQELKGIWVAKFEASASPNSNGNHPGNRYKASTPNSFGGYPYDLEPSNASTYVKIVPGVPSWRDSNVGTFFTLCQKMQTANQTAYGLENNDAHMMKNNEWGAVAYLSASQYGTIPRINAAGTYVEWANSASGKTSAWIDLTTGAGRNPNNGEGAYTYTGATAYNTTLGKESSTTGNVYGIYDMSGGAWEYVAAYLDNNNGNINGQGSSLRTADSKYKDVYQVSEEEKNNTIENTVAGSGTLTQSEIWNIYQDDGTKDSYNAIRSRLTTENYNLLKNSKGDALYEIIENGNYSFFGKIKATGFNYDWMKEANTNAANLVGNWDSDYTLLGHASLPFVLRGGGHYDGSGAGVFAMNAFSGSGYNHCGFRPVVCSPTL